MRTSFSSASFKWLAPLLLLSLWPNNRGRYALAFDFTYGAPTQCDPLNVSWTGAHTTGFQTLQGLTLLFVPQRRQSTFLPSYYASTSPETLQCTKPKPHLFAIAIYSFSERINPSFLV